MTAEQLLQLMNDPENLQKITYEELKSTVLQHPYCQNLRLLLFRKSKMIQKEEDRNLNLAAAYSIDRSYFFEIVKELKNKAPLSSVEVNNGVVEVLPLGIQENKKDEAPIEAESISDTNELIEQSQPRREIKVSEHTHENISPPTENVMFNLNQNLNQEIKVDNLERPIKEIPKKDPQSLKENNAALNRLVRFKPNEFEETNLESANRENQKVEVPKKIEAIETDNIIEQPKVNVTEVDGTIKTPVDPSALEQLSEDDADKHIEIEETPVIRRVIRRVIRPTEEHEANVVKDAEEIPEVTEVKPAKSGNSLNDLVRRSYGKEQDSVSDPDLKNTVNEDKPSEDILKLFDDPESSDATITETATQEQNFETIHPQTPNQDSIEAELGEEIDPLSSVSFSNWLQKFRSSEVFENEAQPVEASSTAVETPDAGQDVSITEQFEGEQTDNLKKPEAMAKKKKNKDKQKDKKEHKKNDKKLKSKMKKAEKKKDKKKKKKKKKKNLVKLIAKKSLLLNEEIASVSLAELLVKQGRYDKAIELYERLSLIFPDKSAFFAEKIDNLKNL